MEREVGLGEGELYLRWVRCASCSLVYLDPRPSVLALSLLYDSKDYWCGEEGYQDYLAEKSWRKRQADQRAHWFVKKLRQEFPSHPLRALEVGSAAGYFLEALAKDGVQAEGLELSKQMVTHSAQLRSPSLKVTRGSVEDSDYKPQSFNGIAAWGCDSNFHDPAQTFHKLANWLQPGGLLALNFHQYDHWARHLKGRFKMTPNALYFLNASHLDTLVRENGLERLELVTERHWMNISTVAHHTGHRWLAPITRTKLATLPLCLPVPGSYRLLARKI